MSVTLAKTAGFCFGVKRATDRVQELRRDPTVRHIYILGALIHNRIYIEELEKQGIHTIGAEDLPRIAEESDQVGKTVLVIRTHGIPMEQDEILTSLVSQHPNFVVEDMTCPFVKRIHKIASEGRGYFAACFACGAAFVV